MAVIFHNCRLIDGIAKIPRDNCDVIVDGDSIASVENSRQWSDGEHKIVPATGSSLLPGLIDCHSHYIFNPWLATPKDVFEQAKREPDAAVILQAARNARVALQAGVTTTRDAGAPRQLNFALRDAIDAGLIPGPRLLAPGLAITITGGHGTMFGIEADGIVELQKAVREQMRDGADVIKIVASEAAMLTTAEAGVEEFTQEEIKVLVQEARRRGLRIFSHAQNSTSLVRSARAGVDSVEHGFLANPEAIAILKEHDTALVPTLAVTAATLELSDISPTYRRRILEIRDLHWASCEEAIRQGVKVVAGTDCGMPGVLPSMINREICLLHKRGLSKMEAIQAATSKAAELLGLEEQVGSVQPGKQADVILVQGNPHKDLSCLDTVDLVMKAGHVLHQRQCMGVHHNPKF